ncbi:MAG: ferrochelatase [Bdellovibrionales bacterium]
MGIKPGLLLVNLGTPDEATPQGVVKYLTPFLLDPYVIDLPWPLRQLLVRGLIIPARKNRVAEAYKQIWTEGGSPLRIFTENFAKGIERELSARFEVRWAMRYGSPSIVDTLHNWYVDKLYLVPLYPQYALSSTESTIQEVKRALATRAKSTELLILKDFFGEPEFIQSQARQIRHWADEFRPDHYLLSFHGLPRHHVTKIHPNRCYAKPGCCEKVSNKNRWCYRAQSMSTARSLMRALNLSAENITVSFQSRLGRRPWIEPYTDLVLPRLAEDGVKRLLVSCPSFVADCLETLEEVKIRLREQFLQLGGHDLQLVPALNAESFWIEDFSQMMIRHNLKWSAE